MRIAITDVDFVLNNHRDDNNVHDDTLYFPVTCASCILNFEGKLVQLSIIGYSRKLISDYMIWKKLHLPIIEQVKMFYDDLAPKRKTINSGLFVPNESNDPKMLKPHL